MRRKRTADDTAAHGVFPIFPEGRGSWSIAEEVLVRLAPFAAVVLSWFALSCGKASRGQPSHAGGEAAGPAATGGSNGAGGTSGARAGASSGVELSRVDLQGVAVYTRVQRLTNRQWERAVTDILRFTEPQNLSASFTQAFIGSSDFDNNEKILFVAAENFRDFELGAEAAATLATRSPQAVAALYPGQDAEGFVSALGRRAFRRPLTAEEQTKYEAVFALGEQLYGAGFANGAALVIRALLQSPHFLYRSELGPAGDPLSGYEIASKLSFWLLGTTPSDDLLDAAAAGDLDRDADIEATARRLLDDPRAVETMRDFHEQLLEVRRFEEVSRARGTKYDAAIDRELVLASDAFFDHVYQENLGLRELLISKRAYVTPSLAALYGTEPPSGRLEPRELGPTRAGYFMQVPFLMLWSESEQSDPIHRGAQLQHMTCGLLGAVEGGPLPPLAPGQTNRQRVSTATGACGATCHSVYMDPLGFALENFDGLGREREKDNGQPVDTSGSYPFAEGVAEFADGTELMKIMAASAQVHTCYAKMVAGYALGRDMVELDRPLLESLGRVSLDDSLKEVAMALVKSPAFRIREGGRP